MRWSQPGSLPFSRSVQPSQGSWGRAGAQGRVSVKFGLRALTADLFASRGAHQDDDRSALSFLEAGSRPAPSVTTEAPGRYPVSWLSGLTPFSNHAAPRCRPLRQTFPVRGVPGLPVPRRKRHFPAKNVRDALAVDFQHFAHFQFVRRVAFANGNRTRFYGHICFLRSRAHEGPGSKRRDAMSLTRRFGVEVVLGDFRQLGIRGVLFLQRLVQKLRRGAVAEQIGPRDEGAVAGNLEVLDGLRGCDHRPMHTSTPPVELPCPKY